MAARTRTPKSSRTFTVILEAAEEGGYHAYCPTLKGCHSEGDTLEQALKNIREAVELYVESLRAAGEAVPDEDLLIKPLQIRA